MRFVTLGYAVAATASTMLIGGVLAAPASADHNRQHTCTQAGGTFFPNQPGPADDRCQVTTTGPAVIVPVGTPTTTLSDPVATGQPTVVDSAPVPAGEPASDVEVRSVGDPVVVETERLGAPVITRTDRDADEATEESVILAGTPTTTTRTERGTPTSTSARGTTNCERVNNDRAAKPVERCERTVVTTTTTPTTTFTAVATPQERVTTSTQPRETVTTTTTPVTPVTTSTQARESCATTTQETEFTRTTTQPTTRTRTVTQQQESRTVTTTTTYSFVQQRFVLPGSVTTSTATAPAPDLVVATPVPGEPIIDIETLPGEAVVTGPVCTPTAPGVDVTEGDTTERVETVVTPTAPLIMVDRETLEPAVTETSAPGQPVVTTSTRRTGETCFKNPSNAEQRRNAC